MASNLLKEVEAIAAYVGSGKAFTARRVSGTVLRSLLEGLAGELLRVDGALEEFRREILPDETVLMLEEWESAVGIPDECFDVDSDPDVRRRNVLAKLAFLGIQTGGDFGDLAERFGVTAFIIPGSRHGIFPFTFPFHFFPNARAAFHTILVDMPSDPDNDFTYTFPLTFGNDDQALVQCLFRHLKPAHVDVVYVTGYVER